MAYFDQDELKRVLLMSLFVVLPLHCTGRFLGGAIFTIIPNPVTRVSDMSGGRVDLIL